jgi:hypothetical protein
MFYSDWNRDHATILVQSILPTAGCLAPNLLGVQPELPHRQCDECTGFRDLVPAWGEADKPNPKTREPDSAAPLVNKLQPGGLNTCIEVGSLGNKLRREENQRLPSDFRVGEGNVASVPMNRSNGSEFILAAKSSQNLAIRWIKFDGWN